MEEKSAANKVICINTFSGRIIYVRTTEEKWKELTAGVEVWAGYMVTGWQVDQDLIEKIVTSAYPQREYYHLVDVRHPSDRPTPDYYIAYSSIDKPEAS